MGLTITGLEDLRIVLREERLRQGMSQSDIPGIGRTTVVGFENGKDGVRIETVFAIAEALGCKFELELSSPSHTSERSKEIFDIEADIDLGEGIGFGR